MHTVHTHGTSYEIDKKEEGNFTSTEQMRIRTIIKRLLICTLITTAFLLCSACSKSEENNATGMDISQESNVRSCVYGAGSIGTVLGAYIAEGGRQVDLINTNEEHIEALRENGAHITGTVEKTVEVSALYPEEMTGKYDVIFLTTKQLINQEVVPFLKDYLSENGVICTLQNGIPEPFIASIVGDNHTMGCTVEWGAELVEPGVVELTSDLDSLSFHLGGMEGVTDAQMNTVKNLLEKMGKVDVEDNLLGARWSKLAINATFSGLGTVVGGTFGMVVEDKELRSIAAGTLKECIDVGLAAGITLEPVQGKDIVKLFHYDNELERAFAELILPLAMRKHKDIVPSMLQDIENGKQCEIDAINGVVCEYGKKAGVPTPYNDKIVEIIHDIQDGKLNAEPSNIELLK